MSTQTQSDMKEHERSIRCSLFSHLCTLWAVKSKIYFFIFLKLEFRVGVPTHQN